MSICNEIKIYLRDYLQTCRVILMKNLHTDPLDNIVNGYLNLGNICFVYSDIIEECTVK